MATNEVDLKRARGNLQLHCKSGTFSIFPLFCFVLFQLEISVGLLDRGRVVHIGLGSQREKSISKDCIP